MSDQTTQTNQESQETQTKTTKEIKQLAFPTADGTAVFDGTKYVKIVNNLTPDPDTGSIYIAQVDSAVADGNNENIADTYVKLATPQTITAQHDFSSGLKINGFIVTVET